VLQNVRDMKKELIKVRKNTYAFFTDESPGLKSHIDGRPMRRVFETDSFIVKGQTVVIRSQFWQCQTTKALQQDEWQLHCTMTAGQRAAETDGQVVFYHTKAVKAD